MPGTGGITADVVKAALTAAHVDLTLVKDITFTITGKAGATPATLPVHITNATP